MIAYQVIQLNYKTKLEQQYQRLFNIVFQSIINIAQNC